MFDMNQTALHLRGECILIVRGLKLDFFYLFIFCLYFLLPMVIFYNVFSRLTE